MPYNILLIYDFFLHFPLLLLQHFPQCQLQLHFLHPTAFLQLKEYRYRSPYFKHIFGSDHYASGYYTYLWAEVLDADGFDLFAQKGIFDKATADAFRTNVLEMGDSDDPMKLYINFRGQEPTVDALLRNRGLK